MCLKPANAHVILLEDDTGRLSRRSRYRRKGRPFAADSYEHELRTRTDESSYGGAGGHDMLTRVDTEGFALGKTTVWFMIDRDYYIWTRKLIITIYCSPTPHRPSFHILEALHLSFKDTLKYGILTWNYDFCI